MDLVDEIEFCFIDACYNCKWGENHRYATNHCKKFKIRIYPYRTKCKHYQRRVKRHDR